MKIKQSLFAIGLGMLASNVCLAEHRFSIETSNAGYEDPQFDADPNALLFGYEYSISEHFSLSAKYGDGEVDGVFQTPIGSAEMEMEYMYGVYAKGYLYPDAKFKPYATLGYTKTKLTASAGQQVFGQSEDGFGYGIGVEYSVNDTMDLSLSYNQLIDKSEVELKSVNIGIGFSF